eukprot:scaffold9146_cov105-Cylindrotheca_fusiformis.AAC.2
MLSTAEALGAVRAAQAWPMELLGKFGVGRRSGWGGLVTWGLGVGFRHPRSCGDRGARWVAGEGAVEDGGKLGQRVVVGVSKWCEGCCRMGMLERMDEFLGG